MKRKNFRLAMYCALFALLVSCAHVNHAPDEPYQFEPIALIPLPDIPNGIAVSNSYVYVAAGKAGLQIISISDPAAPRMIGTVDIPGNAKAVAISGKRAYVAAETGGLQIIDVSNPEKALIIGAVKEGPFVKVAVADPYVFAAATKGGLHIIDVSTPATAKSIGRFEIAGGKPIQDIAVQTPYVYIVSGWPGMGQEWGELSVINVSDPTSPIPVGSVRTRADDHDIVIAGKYAYLARIGFGEGGGLEIVDISDPHMPKTVGYVDTSNISSRGIFDVAIRGKYAYLAAGKIVIVDITDSLPHIVHSIESQGSQSAIDIAFSGSYAYVALKDRRCHPNCTDIGGLQVLKRATEMILPVVPVLMESEPEWYDLSETRYFPTSATVAVSEDLVCSAIGSGHSSLFHTFSTSGPQPRPALGSCELPSEAKDISFWKNLAFIAADSLYMVDLSNPAQPASRKILEELTGACGIDICDSYAYVVNGAGLRIIDIRRPDSAQIVGSVDTPNWAYDVAISKNFAYVADGVGLQIIDISSKNAPRLASSVLYEWAMAKHVALAGTFVYLGDESGLVVVVDASNPAAPVLVQRCQLSGQPGAMAVSGSCLLVPVTAQQVIMELLDITNPANPQRIAVWRGHAAAFYGGAVAVSGSGVYVSDIGKGLLTGPLPGSSRGRPRLQLDTDILSTSFEEKLDAPPLRFEISNTGSGLLSYFISSDAEWLRCRPYSGMLQKNQTQSIEVNCRSSYLRQGKYSANIIVATPSAGDNLQTIEATVEVLPPTYHKIIMSPRPGFTPKISKPGESCTLTFTSTGPFRILDVSTSYPGIQVEKDSEESSLQHAVTLTFNDDTGERREFSAAVNIATDNPRYKQMLFSFFINFNK